MLRVNQRQKQNDDCYTFRNMGTNWNQSESSFNLDLWQKPKRKKMFFPTCMCILRLTIFWQRRKHAGAACKCKRMQTLLVFCVRKISVLRHGQKMVRWSIARFMEQNSKLQQQQKVEQNRIGSKLVKRKNKCTAKMSTFEVRQYRPPPVLLQ